MTNSTFTPGGDAQVIAEIARARFGNYTEMFKYHGWPERGKAMLPSVQTHVAETYGSVRAFAEHFRNDGGEPAPGELAQLRQEVARLRRELDHVSHLASQRSSYYFSADATRDFMNLPRIPPEGIAPDVVKKVVQHAHTLDFNQALNTSSYVNVEFEEEEEALAMLGLRVNLADQTVYPRSYQMHDAALNMIARLWNCPRPDDFADYGVYPGAATVGSTEGCLLAGLALKFAWRHWYAKRHGLPMEQVMGIRPNLVISTCFQAAWEKLFRYMDVEPRLVSPSIRTFTMDPAHVAEAIDDRTIGVVCIMGNHYSGHYDPVWEIDRVVREHNARNGARVGIHVDAASGGFIAPFQNVPPWDFRLDTVQSISTSGHKYGESCCGTGWIVWRRRKGLSEHVAVHVSYLGGKAESYTLNFSRPASGVYVQFYKLLRYGMEGYRQCCESMMANAEFLRQGLRNMAYGGKPRFELLDAGADGCLPVVAARLNPACDLEYNDIDLQHALAQHHWYVGGYNMSFNHPLTEEPLSLLRDAPPDASMFRIVVKNNLTRTMAIHLLESFRATFEFMDSVCFSGHRFDASQMRHIDQRRMSNPC